MRPIIGIVGNLYTIEGGLIPGLERSYVNDDYIKAVERHGASAIILPVVEHEESIKNQLKICSGLILSGGQDIHPRYYNEELNDKIGYVYSRVDEYQIKITKMALELDIPILGICRGHQLINIACGGSLYQDLKEYKGELLKHTQDAKRYDVAHKINIKKDSILYNLYKEEIWVNSYHHQSIKSVGEGLKVTSKSSDGIIESIELINKKFVMGVQWHPEMMLSNDGKMSLLLEEFIKNCN